MDSPFLDNSDFEAESKMALVDEYARQPLVPQVQELQGSTDKQMPIIINNNNVSRRNFLIIIIVGNE